MSRFGLSYAKNSNTLHAKINSSQYIMVLEHCISTDRCLALETYASDLPPLHELINGMCPFIFCCCSCCG